MRLTIAVLVVALLAGCCSHPNEVQALKDAISVNKGHMADTALPAEAHAIAQDNYDFDWSVLYGLTGAELPKDVQARMAARSAEKGGGQ